MSEFLHEDYDLSESRDFYVSYPEALPHYRIGELVTYASYFDSNGRLTADFMPVPEATFAVVELKDLNDPTNQNDAKKFSYMSTVRVDISQGFESMKVVAGPGTGYKHEFRSLGFIMMPQDLRNAWVLDAERQMGNWDVDLSKRYNTDVILEEEQAADKIRNGERVTPEEQAFAMRRLQKQIDRENDEAQAEFEFSSSW